MTVRVRSVSDAAGVECPKKTGEMGEDESCEECEYFKRCWGKVMGVLGWE